MKITVGLVVFRLTFKNKILIHIKIFPAELLWNVNFRRNS